MYTIDRENPATTLAMQVRITHNVSCRACHVSIRPAEQEDISSANNINLKFHNKYLERHAALQSYSYTALVLRVSPARST
jgi:hypothetical protein